MISCPAIPRLSGRAASQERIAMQKPRRMQPPFCKDGKQGVNCLVARSCSDAAKRRRILRTSCFFARSAFDNRTEDSVIAMCSLCACRLTGSNVRPKSFAHDRKAEATGCSGRHVPELLKRYLTAQFSNRHAARIPN